MVRTLRWQGLPIGLAALGIAAALAALPFLAELPIYLAMAEGLAAGTRLPPDGFWAIGYPALIAPLIWLWGAGGLVLIQAGAYGATVWLSWRLVTRHGLTPWLALLALLAVAAHPYLLLNIQRVNDNAFNVPLTLALVAWLMEPRPKAQWAEALGLGALLALFAVIRPNAALFLALPLLRFALDRAWRPNGAWWAAYAGGAALAWVAVSMAATGAPVYWPANGPYNLFAGNNPFAAAQLLTGFNAEYSLDPALAFYGYAGADRYRVDGATYVALTLRFMTEMPGEFLRLLAIKAWVFLGPDWSHAGSAAEKIIQTVLCVPIPLWVGVMVWRVRRGAWRGGGWRMDATMVAFAILFAGPFIASNADPRFRLPLDLALWLHGVVMLGTEMRARGMIDER